MHVHSLVAVMPAYNEAEGLPGFVSEVTEALRPLADDVTVIVSDDCSTDDTVAVIEELQSTMPELRIVRADVNRGHGPTALSAYRAGLALSPDALVHVDGDGQFVGADVARVVRALGQADVVHGVRQGRTDPWFRRALTTAVGCAVAVVAGQHVPDVNTPLRAYRPAALRRLLALVSDEAQVPHVEFSIAETRLRLQRRYVRVQSIPRRGASETGTMWGATRRPPWLPSQRLIAFSLSAAGEVWKTSILRRVHEPTTANLEAQ